MGLFWCVRRGSNPDRRRRRPLWYPIPPRAHRISSCNKRRGYFAQRGVAVRTGFVLRSCDACGVGRPHNLQRRSAIRLRHECIEYQVVINGGDTSRLCRSCHRKRWGEPGPKASEAFMRSCAYHPPARSIPPRAQLRNDHIIPQLREKCFVFCRRYGIISKKNFREAAGICRKRPS